RLVCAQHAAIRKENDAVRSPVNRPVKSEVRGHRHRPPMPRHPRPFPPHRSVARHLNEEWRRLAAAPGTSTHMSSWPLDLARFRHAAPLLAAAGRAGGLPMPAADRLLAVLARLARTDMLAARIVLQRMVPGLVSTAVRRTAGRPHDRQAMFDDLTATAWLVIRSYPIDRRPAKIAVNVLRDTEYLTGVRPTRLRPAREGPTAATND